MSHALLSPSGASRWLVCTPSARLEEQFPDNAGEAAQEGTLAHELSEELTRFKMNWITKKDYQKSLKRIQKDILYKPEMLGHAEDYAVHVIEKFVEAQTHTKDAVMFLEQKLDVTQYVPEGYGTVDNVIIADSVMEITDLKYGKGVPVSSENNRQMMLYALGALSEYSIGYDIDRIRMTIFQPRIDNTSTWEISVTDLVKWAQDELAPKAKQAFEGQGDFIPGNHCLFCRARAVCKANADHQLEVARYEFKDENLLNDDEIADILSRASSFQKWLKAVAHYALSQAVNKDKHWPGFKLVEGKSNRKYSDTDKVAETLKAAGFKEEVIFKKELYGITAMTGLITKKTFEALLTPLLVKPPGKPALVSLDDKRPALDSHEAAKLDFADDLDSDD